MEELPAKDGTGRQRQTNSIWPEGVGPLLSVGSQNNSCSCR